MRIHSDKRGSAKAVVLVLIAAAAAVAAGVLAFRSSASRPSPEEAMKTMTKNMAEVKSFAYTARIDADVDADGSLAVPGVGALDKASLQLSGAVDMRDDKNTKSILQLEATSPDQSQNISAELRMIAKNLYVKPTRAPVIPFFNVSSLQGQWVRIDFNALPGKKNGEGETSAVHMELSPEQKQRIRDAVEKRVIFRVTETRSDETVNGTEAYHYAFSFDKDALVQLIADIREIANGAPVTAEERQSVLDALEDVNVTNGELWIGKRDFLLYKLRFTSDVEKTEQSKTGGTAAVTAEFSDYNKPVAVDAPSDAKSLEDVMGQLLGGLLGGGFKEDAKEKMENGGPK